MAQDFALPKFISPNLKIINNLAISYYSYKYIYIDINNVLFISFNFGAKVYIND
jgi:hypothetical protein